MVDFVFNSQLITCEKPGRDFCEPVSDVNQFRLESSILKHAESSPVGVLGSEKTKNHTQKTPECINSERNIAHLCDKKSWKSQILFSPKSNFFSSYL